MRASPVEACVHDLALAAQPGHVLHHGNAPVDNQPYQQAVGGPAQQPLPSPTPIPAPAAAATTAPLTATAAPSHGAIASML